MPQKETQKPTNRKASELYGPPVPRVRRVRAIRGWTPPDICFQQSRNGITKVPNPPSTLEYHGWLKNKEYCEDTIWNPQFVALGLDKSKVLDQGGELYIQKNVWWSSPASVSTDWKGNTRYWGKVGALKPTSTADSEGSFFPWNNNDTLSTPPVADGDFTSYGPTGWRLAKPAQPMVSLGIAIAELRDLPRMLYLRLKDLKDISDLYLAYQFGWKPLLADIKDMLNYVQKVDERIRFLKANAGKPVRREVQVAKTTDFVVLSDTAGIGLETNTTPWWNPAKTQGDYRRVRTLAKTQEVWFSGRFVFYLDDLKSPDLDKRLYAKLLGLEVDPSFVWEAMPWSWLIDWFTNVGDVISNLHTEVADRQVSEYAYIMGKTTRLYTTAGTDGIVSGAMGRNFFTKRRQIVSPYGLSAGANLSLRQSAILAALAHQKS